ncbi:hypothetical protein BJY04DRAFT_192874 [Aspergillus karnatakaensis]|uniref:uncharacterized protein n=1 Tax=Aspergillus karnatakaensis TaxID=1810916 RepID=UPI003CCCBBF3
MPITARLSIPAKISVDPRSSTGQEEFSCIPSHGVKQPEQKCTDRAVPEPECDPSQAGTGHDPNSCIVMLLQSLNSELDTRRCHMIWR